MFVLPGVLGVVTSLGAMLRGIPPDRSDLMGISPRINLDCERQNFYSHFVLSEKRVRYIAET